jgi:hypothetical protein
MNQSFHFRHSCLRRFSGRYQVVSALLSGTLALGILADADAVDTAPQLLLPGQFHGDEVPQEVGDGWFAVCESKLVPTTVHIAAVVDVLLDAGEEEKTGREVSTTACEEPALLLKNIPGLRERAVTTATVTQEENGDSTISFKKQSYRINQKLLSDAGYVLELTDGKQMQVLFRAEEADAEEIAELWSVEWAGDLDNDGKLDVLLQASDHYNVEQHHLFLSSGAPASQFVNKVTVFKTAGC